MSVISNERYKLFKKLKDNIENFYYRISKRVAKENNVEPINKLLRKTDYIKEIGKSKYTLIIKSYNDNTFSGLRFIESLYYDCLPLILKDTNYDLLIKSFNLDKEKVEKILVDYDLKYNITENERLELLEYFKNKICKCEKCVE